MPCTLIFVGSADRDAGSTSLYGIKLPFNISKVKKIKLKQFSGFKSSELADYVPDECCSSGVTPEELEEIIYATESDTPFPAAQTQVKNNFSLSSTGSEISQTGGGLLRHNGIIASDGSVIRNNDTTVAAIGHNVIIGSIDSQILSGNSETSYFNSLLSCFECDLLQSDISSIIASQGIRGTDLFNHLVLGSNSADVDGSVLGAGFSVWNTDLRLRFDRDGRTLSVPNGVVSCSSLQGNLDPLFIDPGASNQVLKVNSVGNTAWGNQSDFEANLEINTAVRAITLGAFNAIPASTLLVTTPKTYNNGLTVSGGNVTVPFNGYCDWFISMAFTTTSSDITYFAKLALYNVTTGADDQNALSTVLTANSSSCRVGFSTGGRVRCIQGEQYTPRVTVRPISGAFSGDTWTCSTADAESRISIKFYV